MTTKTRAPRSTNWHFTATTETRVDTVDVFGPKEPATDFARQVFAVRGITGEYELTVTR